MSTSVTERIHSHELHDAAATSLDMAKSAIKRLVISSSPLELESLDHIPLKAVSELSRIENPFQQLAHAAKLYEMLPTDDLISTIDPLIDSSSSELVDTLAEEDRRRRLPVSDPEHIGAMSEGVYLQSQDIIATFKVLDAHPSPQTEKLADFAITHAVSNDLRVTFSNTKRYAKKEGIPMMDALAVVRSLPSAFEPNAVIDGYDWLYEDDIAS